MNTTRVILNFALATFLMTPVAHAAADPATKAARQPKRPAVSLIPRDTVVQRDIPYSTNGGVTLKLDLYFPATKPAPAYPVAVYIHGGGWRSGDKASGSFLYDVAADLLRRGYVIAAVDYRLAPAAQWPAFIHDVKAAVRFLRAHAAQYHLDPKRVGTWGSSAGGHLVALLGTADPNAGLEGERGWAGESSRVQAVVDLFGPSDLAKMVGGGGAERRSEVFGSDPDVVAKASPVTYVSKDDPPFLIIHGDADKLVPLEQSQILHERLKAVGGSSTLIVVKGGAHGLTNAGITPTKAELVKRIGDFLDAHLQPAAKK